MPKYKDIPVWVQVALPPIPLLAEAVALQFGKPTHNAIFKGEFGVYEILTVIFSFLAAGLALAVAIGRPRLPSKGVTVWLVLLALGCIYMGGEEASWGQHVFGWEATGYFATENYQQETNLHNLEGMSLTNVIPRNLLTLFMIVGAVIVPLGYRKKVHEAPDAWRRGSFWFWPTMACLVVALFTMLPPIPKKFGWPSMPEPGETEEFYMAMFLAYYMLSIFIRKRSLRAELAEVSSGP